MFKARYSNVFEGPEEWREIDTGSVMTYIWNPSSTYVQYPPFFTEMKAEPEAISDVIGARPLAMLGDSITTDHISPAGSIKKESPAGDYLLQHQVRPLDFKHRSDARRVGKEWASTFRTRWPPHN